MRTRLPKRIPDLTRAGILLLFLMVLLAPQGTFAFEDESWKNALQQLQESFQTMRGELRDYAASLSREAKGLRKGLARLEKQKGQISLWFAGSYDPEDLYYLLKGIGRLRQDGADLLEPFVKMEGRLEVFEPKLDEIEAEIRRQLTETAAQNYTDSLKSSLDEITVLRVELDKVKTHLGNVRKLYADFSARLEEAERSADSKLSSYRSIYYLRPMPGILSPDTWSSLRKDLEQWVLDIGIVKESLGGKREWEKARYALFQGMALAAILILLGWALARRAAVPHGTTDLVSRLLPAWVLLSLSVAVLWVDRSLPFTLYSLSSALTELFLSSGLVALGRALSAYARDQQGKAPGHPFLWYLWTALACGLLLEALGMPYAISMVLWPLALVVTAWRLYRPALSAEGWLERIGAGWSPLVLCGLGLLSLVGFPALSGIIASALFYFLLFLSISVACWRLLQIWETHAKDHKEPLYVIGCLSGIGFPCMILGLLLLGLWLLALRLGGKHVFLDILAFRVDWRDFSLTIEGLTLMVVGFYLTKTAIFLCETFLSELPNRRPDLDKVVIDSLLTLIRYSCWAFFGLTMLFLLGIDLTNLAVIAGGLSVGIGFGLQQIVNNFFSGLILLIGRSIQAGDTIQIGSTLADVRKVTIRNTVVQTRDNATLFIPNSDLITHQLTNWSHRDRRVVREVLVGVAYGTNTEKVRELLLEAARSHPQVLSHPSPLVFFWDFGVSTLDFKIRFWIKNVDHDSRVLSDMRFQIERLFREGGIEIAYPQQDLHLRTAPALEKLWKPVK